jgi:hypothetical protein
MSGFDIFYKKNNNKDLFSYFSDNSDNRITKMQNYIPIYSRFFSLVETNSNKINLNNKYSIKKIREQDTENKFKIIVESDDENKTTHARNAFFKYAPLLDPTKYMAGKYKDISKNIIINLPKLNNTNVLKKIVCYDNSAYTDAFFSYLSSQLLNTYKFTHGLDFFGSFLGIKEKFRVEITDELEYLYDYEHFHENKNILFSTDEIHEELLDDDTRKNRKGLQIGDDTELEIANIDNSIFEDVFQALTENNIGKHNIFFDDLKISKMDYERKCNSDKSDNKTNSACSSRESETSGDEQDDEQDEQDEQSDEDGKSYESSDFSDITNEISNVFANVFEFPCQIICLENLENTMDFLIDNTNLSDTHLISALFQVIMTLIVYQKLFDFTHNDLHTNNIMYQKTEKKYIHYFYNNKYYSVPTFGKIYKIIDFGRSIYKFKDKQISSDCFYNKGEASGQYNFSIFKNKNKKEIKPNNAFDLTRLGCSLYDHYIEEIENDVKTPLSKLIMEWVTDDKGKNILYKKNGEERYPDFKLYKMISRKCTVNTPQSQLNKPVFQKFITTKKKIGKKAKIINIDKLSLMFTN